MSRTRFGAAYRRAIARHLAWHGTSAGAEIAVGGHFALVGARERHVLEEEGLTATSQVVDIGCGAGRLAAALRDLPALRYLGLDVSPELLAHARATTARDDWRFEVVESAAIPLDDAAADLVSMFSVVTHLSDHDARAYVKEAARVLRPGGALVFSFLDPAVPEQRQQLRPAWIEALVTRIAWAPNVATTRATIDDWARDAGLRVTRYESPSMLGQSLAVLRK